MNIYSRFFVLILSLFVFVSPTFATSQDIDFLETLNPFWKVPQIDASEFVFTLNIPIQNSGSVSVIPTGKITLVDDTGNTLKSIGIDGERNEIGTLLQSEVVDYIPLNPEQIKVPAGQTVSLAPEWRGFADEYIEDTVPIIVFSSPFGLENTIPSFAPWEKLIVMEHTKKLTAQVQIEYNDLIGDTSEIQEFSLPIEVPYIEIQVQPNYGLILIVIIGIILVLVLIIPRRKEITKDRNQKAIASLERETKKAMQKIKKKSNSGGSKKVKKQVKKIKNSPKQ